MEDGTHTCLLLNVYHSSERARGFSWRVVGDTGQQEETHCLYIGIHDFVEGNVLSHVVCSGSHFDHTRTYT